MTAVNSATLWVNGQPIGATATGANSWQTASVFSAGLNSTQNIFSVLAVNDNTAGDPSPGFLAAIKIVYADGTSETVVSDASWTVSAVIPATFPIPAASTGFVAATVAAAFGSGPWGSSVTAAAAPSNGVILSGSNWIWATATASTLAATGSVGFRTTVATPGGKVAQSATVIMTADNGFQLYVNGDYIGQSPGVPTVPNFAIAQKFTVALDSASNVFNVIASNIAAAGQTDAGPAGLAASITITYSDGSTSVVVTDATWLTGAFTTVDKFLATADTALTKSFVLGVMGVAPWNALTGLSNALAAPLVPAGPFASGTVPVTSSSAASSSSQTSTTGSSTSSTAGQTSTTATSNPSSTSASAPSSTASAGVAGDTNTNTNTNTSSTSTSHGLSTSATVAIVLVVLALVGLVALFFWRRRKKPVRHSMNGELFDAANGVGQSGGMSSSSASRRTSMTSAAHAEMVMVQPQQPTYIRPMQGAYMQPSPVGQAYPGPQPPAVGYGYPQPQGYPQAQPQVVRQAYPQPPPVVQVYPQQPQAYPQQPPVVQVYPQQPPVAAQAYPQALSTLGHPGNPSRLMVVGEPLSPTSPVQQQMAAQQMAARQIAHRQSTQSTQSSQSSQPSVMPSKLDREEMYWRNNAAGSAASGSARSSAVGLSYASGSGASSSGAQSRPVSTVIEDAYGGMDDPDTVVPPPSYSAEAPLHM
ncbi:hypothetical protein C8R45DRAFT_994587 [Mycena sanguinolenta]|nr:hypothetical protein C8R45DRAFT_994587 [Mycena sanguinolenta]